MTLESSSPLSAGRSSAPDSSARPRKGIGLPWLVVVGLALLQVPRIVAHDFGLVPPNSIGNVLLAILPLITWVAVAAVWSRRPLMSLLVAGGLYGAALATIHNAAWGAVWGASPPRLGGNLSGVLPRAVEEVLMRSATVFSSLATGVAVGLICGLIAWGIQAVARRAGADLPLRRVQG
ncbi:hypothetical protein [Microbacterium sp. P5_E9]